MANFHKLATLILTLPLLSLLLATLSDSTSCNSRFSFMRMTKKNVTNCIYLGALGAEFGWNYNHITSPHNKTVEIFFGARPTVETGWVAWGVNPRHRPNMVGTRALIGFKTSNGSTSLNTYNITEDTKSGCNLEPSKIEVRIDNVKRAYWADTGFFTFSATLTLPQEYNISRLNHVWQVGSVVQDQSPQMHGDRLMNFDSTETIDLISGKRQSIRHDLRHLRMAHGILSMIGWGTLLPIGSIVARYFKQFPFKTKVWYRVHISCQILGYLIGSTGWAIGMWLGNSSKFYDFTIHRNYGIIIFAFTTLQVFALWLRPKRRDEYRHRWNIYHHILGYTVMALMIVNMYKGINILKQRRNWKRSYAAILGVLSSITLVLEVLTWTKFVISKLLNRCPPIPANVTD